MKLIRRLNNNLLTAVIVLLASIVCFAITSYLINTALQSVPYGFLLAGGVIAFLHSLSSFLVKIDEKKETSTFSILAIGLRLIILLTVLILIMLMYYRWGLKLFNVFVFIGVYTFSVVVYMLTFILRKNRKE